MLRETLMMLTTYDGDVRVHRVLRAGAQLFINEETLKSYVKRIFSKLQARDRTHAVMIGLRRGIIRI